MSDNRLKIAKRKRERLVKQLNKLKRKIAEEESKSNKS